MQTAELEDYHEWEASHVLHAVESEGSTMNDVGAIVLPYACSGKE
jgi:hypothetical protein